MNKCKKCGVELDVEMNFCPLCGQKSSLTNYDDHREKSAEVVTISENSSYNLKELTEPQKKMLFWEISGIILISGMFVTSLLDLIINKQISWSRYSITIGLFLLINISLISYMNKRVVLLLAGSFISSSLLLLMFDYFNQYLNWGYKLGIPIIFFIYLIIFLLIVAIKKSKQKGINIIAYFLIATGILCICIESIISIHLINHIKLQWSLITMTSVFTVSGIILFIHFRLKKATDLKKFFHI
jgi:hypothetical protein